MRTLLLPLLSAVALAEQDSRMVPAYMDACIKVAVAGRAPAQLDERTRHALRQELLGALGLAPPPEKTPLNAKVTGRLERDGYVIEKVIYETFPRFYATAYLYLPAQGDRPFPVVVSPVGHWSRKKLEPVVQARCIGLALNGFAVLCIDMPGFVGNNNDERNFPGNHSDWLLHMSSLPPIGPMVWDVVRGVDYLETRPEIDTRRIGLTGESGGGLTTMYAAVVEDRIRCYVPVCYASSYADNYHNGCLCNHVPGVMVIGDRSDVMALAAPKPVLLIGAENDPEFPKPGMLRSHAKLLGFYEAGGAADRCEVLIAPGGHDYSQPMRERMYGFVRKHLQGVGDGEPAPERRALPATAGDRAANVEDPALAPDPGAGATAERRGQRAELMCFPDGRPPADARSLRQLALEKARKLAEEADRAAGGLEPAQLRAALRSRLARLYPSPDRVSLDVQVDPADPGMAGSPPTVAAQVTGSYVSEPGLRIPFALRAPASPSSEEGQRYPARIVFSEGGLADATAVVPEPDSTRAVGGAPAAGPDQWIELRLDGRGLGRLPGLDMKLATYLGRPDVWMWAWDVSRAVDYLLTRGDVDSRRVEVWGFGPAGGQVAYLAALLDPRITHARGQRTLRSYLDAFDRDDLPRFALPHRILEVADLPLMRRALAGQ